MLFRLSCITPGKPGQIAHLYYNNETGLLHDSNGGAVGSPRPDLAEYEPAFKTQPMKAPVRKHNAPRVLKIQLGLSCNYSCSYCLQKQVSRPDETNSKMVNSFIAKVRQNVSGQPDNIQLWGGEPLVYIKTLKPLVKELKVIFTKSKFTMITNAALLNSDTNQWILENDIGVSISHDGPGQKYRGPDPFDEPELSAAILDLYWAKKARGDPLTFGAMIHAQNHDRAAVARWFHEKVGDKDVVIGEGAIIEVYDEGAKQNCPRTHDERLLLRKTSLRNTRRKSDSSFFVSRMRMSDWLDTMWHGRMLDSLGMKCGMDSPDTLTVDLLGNVITCQNVSTVSLAPNGKSHRGGSIDKIEDVEINTSVHFMNRAYCHTCPVVQLCRGGCMYLVGDLFYASCNNTYTDHIPYFAAAVEALTGLLPIYVEDQEEGLPEERKDIFGFGNPNTGTIDWHSLGATEDFGELAAKSD